MTIINIAIAGSGGRMGRALIDAVLNGGGGFRLHAALEHPQSPLIGKDAGELAGAACGVKVRADVEAALAGATVLIDFTRPEATLAHLAICRNQGVKAVIGTTGFEDAGKAAVAVAARDIGIVFAPNMSVGTNVVFKLLEVAARALKDGYDIEIIEAHHRHKVDAPSGTALRMGEVVAAATGRDLKKNAVFARVGLTGERPADAIGFATVRGGDIVGDHTVLFAGTGERVEVSVKAGSRATYAEGALRGAKFLADKKSGLFDMHDVLGLR